MPRGPVSFVLLSVAALAVAGSALAALPPPPTVSVPTVTVPIPPAPLPVPLPPPPTVTAPPKMEVPAPPAPPPETKPPPAPVARAEPPPQAPATSSAIRTSRRGRTASRQDTSKAERPSLSRRRTIVRVQPRAGVRGVATAPPSPVHGRPAEGAGVFGPIGTAFNALDVPREVVPAALFAMAALAILLLGLASAPLPARTSRTGAMLVHMRGSIALAGTGALLLAVGTYLVL
jgi:hypothetical protein